MTRRAGIYVRISRDADGEGLGVGRQEVDCRALAERLGWDVVAVYVDNDISATSGKPRPEWARLIADLKGGAIDAVLAYRVDRMYRRTQVAGMFLRLIERTGAKCHCVVGGEVEAHTSTGRMTAQVLAAVAEHEAATTSERRRRAADQAADAGEPHSGARPYGYDDDGITQRPHEADVIRKAAEDLLDGVSARTVVRGLNAAGQRTARGKPWTTSSLRAVLIGYRVAGRRQRIVHDACDTIETSEGDFVSHRKCSRIDGGPAAWDPILDAKTWDAVRAHYAGNERRPIQTRKHLLMNLAVCATCDAQLEVKTKSLAAGGGKSYVCPTPKKNGKPHAYIIAEPFQEIVSRWSAEAVVETAHRAIDPTTVARELRDERAAVQRDLDDLAEARYVAKSIDDSQFMRAQAPLRKRANDLDTQIAERETEARSVRVSVPRMFGDPGPWEDHLRANFADIRADLEAKISRVVVSPGGRGRPAKPKDATGDWRDAVYRQRVHDRVQLEYRPGVIARPGIPSSA